MAKLFIVDDHEIVRSGLRALLEPRWDVIGEACDGKAAIRKAVELKPDVVIMDYALPSINGVEAARQILLRLPATQIVMCTMHDEEELIDDLLAAGVRGCVLKSDAGTSLTSAVEAVLQHRPFFSGRMWRKHS
jgi:DNA-binding NarL/FixJ family response regulator